VFERVSAIARAVVPDDLLSLPLLSEDRKAIILHAIAGATLRFPERPGTPHVEVGTGW
jgi:hypothetical protein